MASIDCREAETILHNDTWIQTIEIKKKDDAVVKARFRIEHKTTTVLSFLTFFSLTLASFSLLISSSSPYVFFAK